MAITDSIELNPSNIQYHLQETTTVCLYQQLPQSYSFSPSESFFFIMSPPAERSPGDDRHSDDGVHCGDDQCGEGDGLHSPVFSLQP